MQEYAILREGATLELVAIIKANNIDEAKEIATKMGYDLEYYRVEESWEG